MKIKDMETCMAAGTEVAVGKYGAQRARIIGLRQDRRVYSGARWDWGGHAAHDGVRVLWLDGSRAGQHEVVGPREVLATWTDHVALKTRTMQHQAEAQARLEDQKLRAEAAAAAINDAFAAQGSPGRARVQSLTSAPWKVHGYAVTLDLAGAEAIATVLS